MQARRRLVVGMVLAAVAEAALGAAALAALGPQEIALFVLACAVATGAVTGLLARLLAPDGGGRGGGDGDTGEPPPWWPGFERDFWRYVRDGDRTPV